MDYAIIGGDARYAHLTKLLCARGRDARAVGTVCADVPNVARAEREALSTAKSAILPWPTPDGEALLNLLPPGAKAYTCGPGAVETCPETLRVINLWKDERLQLENAWLTAEGAICAAMNAGKRAMRDCHCLVVGWGRIGRALTEMLIGLGAPVTVASRSERGRNGAAARGAENVSTYNIANALPGKQIVFSTPPFRVLGEEALRRADHDALIIDLASAPYGVDLDAARVLGLHAWREPGLPGRYCPISAAKALMSALDRAERKD